MRVTPIQLFLRNLKGSYKPNELYYIKREASYEGLKKLTGVDFGYDVKKWEKWIDTNKKIIRNRREKFLTEKNKNAKK
jgi:hypothetical protein